MVEKRALIALHREKKILLQHRDENAPTLQNHWAFFGGSPEEGEEPEQAVRREAREELGIEPEGLRFFKKFEFQTDLLGPYEAYVFTAPLKHSVEELKKQQMEGDDLCLFSQEELEGKKIWKYDAIMLKELFSYLRSSSTLP